MKNISYMPNMQNTVLKDEEIQDVKIRFAKISTLTKMYNVSRATIYRWIREAEQSEEWQKLFIEVSSSLTLINLEEWERFLYSKHRKYL